MRSIEDRRAMHIHPTPADPTPADPTPAVVDLVERAEKIAATRKNLALRALLATERALLI